MDDLDLRLANYKNKAEELLASDLSSFKSLYDIEVVYFKVINEGTSIRSYILEHPECCDKQSYLVLNNNINEPTYLKDKFKSLSLNIYLSQKLFEFYQEYVKLYKENGDDSKLISMYERLFNLTKNTLYKKMIADLLYQKYKNYKQALEIYASIEGTRDTDVSYGQNYSEILKEYGNSDKMTICNEKAYILSSKEKVDRMLADIMYIEDIKVYEDLFKHTHDYNYKKDIANIYAVCLFKFKKAVRIYKSIEKYLGNDSNYWFQLSEVYECNKDFYNEVLCIQKALSIELN